MDPQCEFSSAIRDRAYSGGHFQTLLFVLVSKKYHLFWLLDQTQIHPDGKSTAGLTSGDSKSKGSAGGCADKTSPASDISTLTVFCTGGDDDDDADDSRSLAENWPGFGGDGAASPVVVCSEEVGCSEATGAALSTETGGESLLVGGCASAGLLGGLGGGGAPFLGGGARGGGGALPLGGFGGFGGGFGALILLGGRGAPGCLDGGGGGFGGATGLLASP